VLAETLQLNLSHSPALYDRSPLGQMKDGYPLRLVTLADLLKLLQKRAHSETCTDPNPYFDICSLGNTIAAVAGILQIDEEKLKIFAEKSWAAKEKQRL
jgi:hypothetical protein